MKSLKDYKLTSLPFILVNREGKLYRQGRIINQVSAKGVPYERYQSGGEFEAIDNGLGYLQVKSTVDSVSFSKYLHVLVWETFVGEIPDGYEINHINHVKSDCSLGNLELVTHKENIERMLDFYGIRRKSESTIGCTDILQNLSSLTEDKDSQDFFNELLWSVREQGWLSTAKMVQYSDNGLRKKFERVTGSSPSLFKKKTKPLVYKTGNPEKFSPKLSEEDKEYILSKYKSRCPKYGARALGRKLGIHHTSILRYVKSKDL